MVPRRSHEPAGAQATHGTAPRQHERGRRRGGQVRRHATRVVHPTHETRIVQRAGHFDWPIDSKRAALVARRGPTTRGEDGARQGAGEHQGEEGGCRGRGCRGRGRRNRDAETEGGTEETKAKAAVARSPVAHAAQGQAPLPAQGLQRGDAGQARGAVHREQATERRGGQDGAVAAPGRVPTVKDAQPEDHRRRASRAGAERPVRRHRRVQERNLAKRHIRRGGRVVRVRTRGLVRGTLTAAKTGSFGAKTQSVQAAGNQTTARQADVRAEPGG
mmetsp:Transcript_5717/g.25771  ORF Transcript_5717/g.25771 Transcript_5717/m.25771 type:complete len:274 (+) Transcript_5717:408-1229(+)